MNAYPGNAPHVRLTAARRPHWRTRDQFVVARIGTDEPISGFGEQPIVDHFHTFGLRAFASGSYCIAPALSNGIRAALHDARYDDAAALREHFLMLENACDAWSPIRVLHAVIEAAGIAKTGPIGKFLATIDDPRVLADIAQAATRLAALNAGTLPG